MNICQDSVTNPVPMFVRHTTQTPKSAISGSLSEQQTRIGRRMMEERPRMNSLAARYVPIVPGFHCRGSCREKRMTVAR